MTSDRSRKDLLEDKTDDDEEGINEENRVVIDIPAGNLEVIQDSSAINLCKYS